MNLTTICRIKWRLLFLTLLIIICRINAQLFEQPEPAVKYQSPQFNDPIRRALGLWSRLLNRMSQPNDPTDDQLHLRIQDGDKSAFEDLELPALFGNLNQRRDKNARQPPIQSASNSIINEERLNEILPRMRQPETTTSISEKSTTTVAQKISTEPSKEDDIKSTKNPTKKSNKKSTENKLNEKSKKKSTKSQESLENNDSIKNSQESHEDRNTSSAENESFEVDEIRTTTSKKFSTITTTKQPTTTTKKPSSKKLTKEIEESTSTPLKTSTSPKSPKSPKSTTILLSTKLSTQKPSTTKAQKTKLKTVLHVDPEETTTSIKTTPNTEPTKKKVKSKPIKHVSTTESYDSELLEGTLEDDEFDGSGEEDLKETTLSNIVVKGRVTRGRTQTNKSRETSKSRQITLLTKSSTKPRPKTILLKTTTIESITKRTAEEPIETKPPTSTKKLVKNEEDNDYSEEKEIPEAEEAEFQTDEKPMTTTIANIQPSVEGHGAGIVDSTESQENERKMQKMMTPVSSIIDGIGPLILPLLGYSRQTIGGILNPGLAAIAGGSSGARAAGVRNFRPQQVPTNPQIVRQPTPREQLDGSQSFQQVMAPFQQERSSSPFQQAPTSRKSYGPKQQKVKNYPIEAISLPPADFYNNRQRVSQVETSSGGNELTSFVRTRSSAPDLRDPTQQASVVPVGQNPTYNRMVNADTNPNGYAQRYIPDPPALQKQQISQIDQATMIEVYRQILARRGLKEPSLRGVNEDQLAQIAQLAAQIPKSQNNFVKINPASKNPPEIRRQPSVDDPGYQMGRSSVVSSFYEDSGIMVGANPVQAPQTPTTPTSNSIGTSGFGGGRRPDSSFEQVAVATLEDERLFL